MTVFESFEVENQTLNIFYDGTAESPRTWDSLGTIVAWHSRYDLMDDGESYADARQFFEYNTEHNFETQDGIDNASDRRLFNLFQKDNIILPVYMFEHGNVILRTSSFSDKWDSGQVGYIFVSKEDVKKEYDVKRISKKLREKVESVLKSEIEVYSKYVNGDVIGFELLDNEGKQVDSCHGFYGYDYKNNGMLDHLPEIFHSVL